MYYIAICDDEKSDRQILREYLLCSGFSKEEVIFQEFSSGKEMLEQLSADTDAVFLDIQMEEMDGKETAIKLRKFHKNTMLIFFTALTTLTYEICKVTPFRYIEKGFRREQMIEELKEVTAEIRRRKELPLLQVRCDRKKKQIRLCDIVYIERARGKCIVHLSDTADLYGEVYECAVMESLESLEQRLSIYGFGYPHNSYIVNIGHIRRYENHELFLDNGECVSVARSKEEMFKKKYAQELCREG